MRFSSHAPLIDCVKTEIPRLTEIKFQLHTFREPFCLLSLTSTRLR